MKAGDLMTPMAYSVTNGTTAAEVAVQLLTNPLSGFLVLDPERDSIIGIVTKVDIIKAIRSGRDLRSVTAADLMTPHIISVDIDTPIAQVVEMLERHGIRRMPVTRAERIVGVISKSDLPRPRAGLRPVRPGHAG